VRPCLQFAAQSPKFCFQLGEASLGLLGALAFGFSTRTL
jgi:hypothetical protein